MLKNTLLVVAAVVGLSSTVFAGTKPVAQVVIPDPVEHFDFTAKVYATSVIPTNDVDFSEFGAGISLELPLFNNFKVELAGAFAEDEVYTANINLLYYFPVTSKFSAYLIEKNSYDFETESFGFGLGAGVKYSFTPQFSLFTDAAYHWTDANEDVVGIRAGIGFSF